MIQRNVGDKGSFAAVFEDDIAVKSAKKDRKVMIQRNVGGTLAERWLVVGFIGRSTRRF